MNSLVPTTVDAGAPSASAPPGQGRSTDQRAEAAARGPGIYRVCWRSKLTGAVGYGSWFLERGTVEAWIMFGDEFFPEAEHWVEEGIAS